MAFQSSPDEVLSILLDVDVNGLEKLDTNMGKWNQALNAGMGAAKAFIGTIAAIDAAIIGFGVTASRKAADFEALTMSLNAVEGSASKASKAIAALREIAKGPGLGVESAIETYAGLRRGGLDSAFAMDLTRNIGNAIAYTGGGRDELSRISIALNQIAMSPTLKGQDAMQLAQARLPVYAALKNAFGTADTAELDKMGITSAQALKALNDEFAKIPKVAGGAKNSFENLGDAIDYAMILIGTGINQGIMPIVNEFVDAIDKLNSDGSLKDFGAALSDAFTSVLDSVTGSGKSAQEVIDDVMTGILTIAYGSRNAVLNIQDLFGIAAKLFPQYGLILNGLTGGDDPYKEAQSTMDSVRAGRANRERAAMVGMVDQGERYVYVPGKGWVREAQLTDEDKKKAKDYKSSLFTEEPEKAPTAEENKPAVKYLREIAKNTKTMAERLEDSLMGGGVATERYFNSRNIAHASGEHASGGYRMILQGIQQVMNDQLVQGARAGNWRRSS